MIKPLKWSVGTSQEGCTQVLENTNESTTPTSPQSSRSLQILKNALDRATKIVRSISPNSNDSCPSPPFKYYQDFEVSMDDNQDRKQLFENLYDLQVNDDDEIKIIERSVARDETFLFDKPNIDNTTANDETQESSNNVIENDYSHSYNATSSRNFVCESIAEVSGELNISQNDAKEKKTESSNTEVITTEENATTSETVQNSETSVKKNDADTKTEIKDEEKPVTIFDFMFMNDSTRNKNCKTCRHSSLPRRRSLPAALNQLRTANSNSPIGKLPIRKGVSIVYTFATFASNLYNN